MKHSQRFVDLVGEARRRVREGTVHDVKAMLDGRADFELVEVREESEWAAGHLPGAVHIGKGVIERDVESRIPDLDRAIVLYCGGGYRSALAADAIQRMGYRKVTSMDGGFRAWNEAGYPVVKD